MQLPQPSSYEELKSEHEATAFLKYVCSFIDDKEKLEQALLPL
jgi:hypothetical protein